MSVCVAVLAMGLALTFVPAGANAAAPVLEFVSPGHHFPIDFEADGGEVTAVLAGFDTVVQCTGSEGEGEITGPRSTLSNYVFTGCETQGGSFPGHECKSGANDGEITTGTIEADLVYIDQANHEVGILLNPSGGAYMNFECGGEAVEASGPFLSPVGPINQIDTSFTAALTRSGATQTPNEYENENGEKLPAIPMGKRGANPLATTGVELSFTITPEVPLEIKAITAADLEAKRQEEEAATAAAVKKRQEAEAATAAAVKKRMEEEAATTAAVKKRQEAEAAAKAKSKQLTRGQLLTRALKQCKKSKSKHKRVQCEKLAKKKYGGQEKPKTHKK